MIHRPYRSFVFALVALALVAGTTTARSANLINEDVLTILPVGSDTLWIGTFDGLSLYNGKTFTNFTPEEGLSNHVVKALVRGPNGDIWVGTEFGLNRLNLDTRRFDVFFSEVGFADDDINALYFDNEEQLWIATFAGLSVFDGFGFTTYTADDGLGGDEIFDVTQDSDGNMWAATIDGLSRFDGDTWVNFSGSGLNAHAMHTVFIDNGGTIWVGTFGGGVSRFNTGSETFTTLDVDDGLIDNEVLTIAQDAEGNLWFGTYAGASRYDGSIFTNFTEDDGLINDEVRSIRVQGINIWFGTGGGVGRRDGTGFAASLTVPNPGIITTLGGTSAILAGRFAGDGGDISEAAFRTPRSVIRDEDGNLFILDTGNHRVRKVGTDGIITTIVGSGPPSSGGYGGDDGPATEARLNRPQGLAIGDDGWLYIADTGNHRVRVVDSDGIITTVAGGGSAGVSPDSLEADESLLNSPGDVAVDENGLVYIADTGNHRIAFIDESDLLTTIAGTGRRTGDLGDGKVATEATLSSPAGIAVFQDPTIGAVQVFVADTGHDRVRWFIPGLGRMATVAGSGAQSAGLGDGGAPEDARLSQPHDVFITTDDDDNIADIYIADTGNSRIRKVDTGANLISTVVGGGNQLTPALGNGGSSLNAVLVAPTGVAVFESPTSDGSPLRILVSDAGNHRLRLVNFDRETGEPILPAKGPVVAGIGTAVTKPVGAPPPEFVPRRARGIIQTIAGGTYVGDGQLATEVVLTPTSAIVDREGNIFIADAEVPRIRRVDAGSGLIQTIAGGSTSGEPVNGAQAATSSIRQVRSMTLDGFGNLYGLEHGGAVYVIERDGRIRTVNLPIVPGLNEPSISGIAIDSEGNIFYADRDNNRIWLFSIAWRTVSAVAGNGEEGEPEHGPATESPLQNIKRLVLDNAGNVFFRSDPPPSSETTGATWRIDAVTGILNKIEGDLDLPFVLDTKGRFIHIDHGGILTYLPISERSEFLFTHNAGALQEAGIRFDPDGNYLLTTGDGVVRMDPVTGDTTRLAGGGPTEDIAALRASIKPVSVAAAQSGDVYINSFSFGVGRLYRIAAETGRISLLTRLSAASDADNIAASQSGNLALTAPVLDHDGNVVFVADDGRVRTIDGNGIVRTILKGLSAVAVTADREGNLFVADDSTATVVRIDRFSGQVETIAGGGSPADGLGDGGPATLAQLNEPLALAVDTSGAVYIVDRLTVRDDEEEFDRRHRVRKVDSAGVIQTVAGNGEPTRSLADRVSGGDLATESALDLEATIAVDVSGALFLSESTRILRINPNNGRIAIIAGSGVGGFAGDDAPAVNAQINRATGLAITQEGDLLIADQENSRVRRVVGVAQHGIFATRVLWADFNGNGSVDFNDFLALSKRWFKNIGDPLYSPRFDVDGDGTIGFTEFQVLAEEF